MHFVVMLLLLMVESRRSNASDYSTFGYSTIDCEDKIHTMVRFPEGIPGPNCHEYIPDKLGQSDKDAILHLHNYYRNEIALGNYPPFPMAADMLEMHWDEELEEIAQRWADQCIFAHDDCNDVERFSVGQNVSKQELWPNNQWFYDSATRVHKWFNEIVFYSYAPGPFTFSQEAGHFTQVIWGSTCLIGCGRSTFVVDNQAFQILVCNYGPAGNRKGQPLYTEKTPYSQKCNQSPRYPGLCKVLFPSSWYFT